MPLPRSVARFNKRWTNRFLEPLAKRSAGFAVVHHVGRTSGRAYSTPVNAFGRGAVLIVTLSYGPSADWVRNVQANPRNAEIEVGKNRWPIIDVEIVGRREAATALPAFVRLATRVLGIHDFLRVERGVRSETV
ncbi:MAG: nitroreductase family deazaflavin-dependent oxidoreductase [Acidimicrobiales bacterium]